MDNVTAIRTGMGRVLDRASARAVMPLPVLLAMTASGAILGLLALTAPPPVLLLAPIVVLGLWLITRWPELGVLLVLLYTSTILSEEVLPPLPIGVGSLHLSDLIVLWLFALLVLRLLLQPQLRFRRTALDVPVALFVGVGIAATLRGVGSGDIAFDAGIRELRGAGYLVLYFVITNLLHTPAQMRRLWGGVMLLAVLTAIAAILQAVLGPSVPIIPGRVEALSTQGLAVYDVARVIPPGESLLYLLLIVAVLAYASDEQALRRLRRALVMGLLAVGLLLTYRRALWGSAALAVLAALPLITPIQRARLLRAGLLAATLLALSVAGLLTMAPKSELSRSLQATGTRIASMFDLDSYQRGDSNKQTLEQRFIEIEYALPQVLPPPLIGHGLGAAYRPCLTLDRRDCVAPSYIHNAYVSVLFKLGLVGAIAFVWIGVGTLRGGFEASARLRRAGAVPGTAAPDPAATVQVLGSTVAFAALLPALLLEPYIFIWSWTPVIAIMLASVHWWHGPSLPSLPGTVGPMATTLAANPRR